MAPNFEMRDSKVEAYLLDYEGDLYGEVVDVSFVERLRPEKRFSDIEELKTQITRDVSQARKVVS